MTDEPELEAQDPLSERVLYLLDKIWAGNQSRMSADTGVAQPTISNVRIGRAKPGRGMLEKVARHPLVNQNWLMTGEGSPIAWASTGDSGSVALHVALRPFTGMPQDHPESLGEMREVGLRFYRPSRYWLPVRDWFKIVLVSDIRHGDWLLLDPEIERYSDLSAETPVLRQHDGEYYLTRADHDLNGAASPQRKKRRLSLHSPGEKSLNQPAAEKTQVTPADTSDLVAVVILLDRVYC